MSETRSPAETTTDPIEKYWNATKTDLVEAIREIVDTGHDRATTETLTRETLQAIARRVGIAPAARRKALRADLRAAMPQLERERGNAEFTVTETREIVAAVERNWTVANAEVTEP